MGSHTDKSIFSNSALRYWEVDNLVEFVHIFHFMIYERYVSDIFRATFPQNYCR